MKNLRQKARKNLPNILRLLKYTEIPLSTIAIDNNTTIPFLRRIAIANGISQERLENANGRKHKSRNNEIISLLIAGHTFRELANKYSISAARVQQIAKNSGLMIHDKNRKSKVEIVKKIHEDIVTLTYSEIKEKYKTFNGHSWISLHQAFQKEYGKSLVDIMREIRNKLIVDKYSSGEIARKIIKMEDLEFKSPIHFDGINNIYRVSSSMGFKKFPQIKNRAAGGICEDKDILDKIVKMRKKNISFRQIADSLNEQNFKTITGVAFATVNTNRKYLDYTRNKPKNKK